MQHDDIHDIFTLPRRTRCVDTISGITDALGNERSLIARSISLYHSYARRTTGSDRTIEYETPSAIMRTDNMRHHTSESMRRDLVRGTATMTVLLHARAPIIVLLRLLLTLVYYAALRVQFDPSSTSQIRNRQRATRHYTPC